MRGNDNTLEYHPTIYTQKLYSELLDALSTEGHLDYSDITSLEFDLKSFTKDIPIPIIQLTSSIITVKSYKRILKLVEREIGSIRDYVKLKVSSYRRISM